MGGGGLYYRITEVNSFRHFRGGQSPGWLRRPGVHRGVKEVRAPRFLSGASPRTC